MFIKRLSVCTAALIYLNENNLQYFTLIIINGIIYPIDAPST